MKLDDEAAEQLEQCVAEGGVAVFPSDTVYGVCCDPENEQATRRLYMLKGRPSARACAVMFFSLDVAMDALEDLHDAERTALHALLPGPVTVLISNRAQRYPSACRIDPGTLGLRVPALTSSLAPLGSIARPVLQSSANLSGEPDARTLADVPQRLRDGADLVIDGGELPGTPSTVVDLRDLDSEGRWYVLREGALPRETVQEKLALV
ncbi:MAG TPA: L-threonylcarbamoyladenylate synthase [Solirubrobacteraceae bacterium]